MVQRTITYEKFIHAQEPADRPVRAYVLDDADPVQLHTVQMFWSRRVRRNVPLLFLISIVINIGMWLERYVIVVTSLHRDFIPAAWDMYHGTFWDYATFYGSFGLFFSLAVPVHPVPAGDLDHRDARAGARDAARAGTRRSGLQHVDSRGSDAMKVAKPDTGSTACWPNSRRPRR